MATSADRSAGGHKTTTTAPASKEKSSAETHKWFTRVTLFIWWLLVLVITIKSGWGKRRLRQMCRERVKMMLTVGYWLKGPATAGYAKLSAFRKDRNFPNKSAETVSSHQRVAKTIVFSVDNTTTWFVLLSELLVAEWVFSGYDADNGLALG